MATNQRKVYYRRYAKPVHLCPVPGYHCPRIPLGGVGGTPDYEIVRVVRSEGCRLKGMKVLISWGANLSPAKAAKIKQVLACNIDNPAQWAEIVLAVAP